MFYCMDKNFVLVLYNTFYTIVMGDLNVYVFLKKRKRGT